MESFADQIRKYLGEHNISFSQAAKMTGIERTILSRYASGSRRPNTLEVVAGLADGLHMSQEEKKELCDAYKRMRISEEFGVKEETLLAVLGCKGGRVQLSVEEDTVEAEYLEETAMDLKGEESIAAAIRYILKDAKYAKLHFTPGDYFHAENLKSAFSGMCRIENWEQILCLEHQEWKSGEERIQTLLCLMPYLFCDGEISVYYHYRKQESSIIQQVKGQYLLTDKGIVFFDRDLERGFFSNEKGPCEFYEMLFQDEKKKCRIFTEVNDDLYQMARMWQTDMVYKNEDTGVSFIFQKETTCMWIINDKKQTVCIRESGSMQVLWKYIWGIE